MDNQYRLTERRARWSALLVIENVVSLSWRMPEGVPPNPIPTTASIDWSLTDCRAAVHCSAVMAWVAGVVASVAGGWSWWIAYAAPTNPLVHEVGFLAAVAMVVFAASIAAWVLARSRYEIALASDLHPRAVSPDGAGLFGRSSQDEHHALLSSLRQRLGSLARVVQVAIAVPALAVAGATLVRTWPSLDSGTANEPTAAMVGLLAAFVLLVVERLLSATTAWPDAERMGHLLRGLIVLLTAAAVSALVHGLGVSEVAWVQRVLASVLLVALFELVARAPLVLFLPRPDPTNARLWLDSWILRWCGKPLNRRSGTRPAVDLRQSWALWFVRRSMAPLALALVFGLWGLSGVAVIGVAERGIRERGGVPVEVLSSGLHFNRPWPFGAVRRIEHGQLHETALALGGVMDDPWKRMVETVDADGLRRFSTVEGPDPRRVDTTPLQLGAEDVPPPALDRLWDRAHTGESTFLVPSPGAGDRGQSVQLLNSDVRVVWRVGASDAAAISATYRLGDPATAIHAIAAQVLTELFQRHTLDQIISGDRDALVQEVRNGIQQELDRLAGGIDIATVVIDAIHPPPKAAPSYYAVQAAAITAATDITVARGKALASRHDADGAATVMVRGREALARELLAKAAGDQARFAAEAALQRDAGTVMDLERWLQSLARALARSQLVIIDHRIPRDEAPYLDFRPAAAAVGDSRSSAAPAARTTP